MLAFSECRIPFAYGASSGGESPTLTLYKSQKVSETATFVFHPSGALWFVAHEGWEKRWRAKDENEVFFNEPDQEQEDYFSQLVREDAELDNSSSVV